MQFNNNIKWTIWSLFSLAFVQKDGQDSVVDYEPGNGFEPSFFQVALLW